MLSSFWEIKSICYLKVGGELEKSLLIGEVLFSDSESYLSDIRKCLENECTKRGLGKHIVKYYGLISARTGYGIEDLISKVFRYWSQHGLSEFIILALVHFISMSRWCLSSWWYKRWKE